MALNGRNEGSIASIILDGFGNFFASVIHLPSHLEHVGRAKWFLMCIGT